MRTTIALSLAGLTAATQFNYHLNTTGTIEYTTEVVTALTTYCPYPTTITHGHNTYTVTEATTLTITDCPCTVSKPVHSEPVYTQPPHSEKPSYTEPSHPEEPVYTTKVVTELTTYCPEPTTITHGTKTYTVTEPTTLTITDCPCTVSEPVTYAPPPKPTHSAPEPVPTPEPSCPEKCSDAYNVCRGRPGSNKATCAAQYASCLGYNPFGNDGSLVTPTACSEQPSYTTTTKVVTELTTYCPEPTTITHGTKTYTVTEPTSLTITDCPCTVTESHPAPSKPAPSKPVVTEPVHPEPSHPAPEQPQEPEPSHPAPEQPEQPKPTQPQPHEPTYVAPPPQVPTTIATTTAPAGEQPSVVPTPPAGVPAGAATYGAPLALLALGAVALL